MFRDLAPSGQAPTPLLAPWMNWRIPAPQAQSRNSSAVGVLRLTGSLYTSGATNRRDEGTAGPFRALPPCPWPPGLRPLLRPVSVHTHPGSGDGHASCHLVWALPALSRMPARLAKAELELRCCWNHCPPRHGKSLAGLRFLIQCSCHATNRVPQSGEAKRVDNERGGGQNGRIPIPPPPKKNGPSTRAPKHRTKCGATLATNPGAWSTARHATGVGNINIGYVCVANSRGELQEGSRKSGPQV